MLNAGYDPHTFSAGLIGFVSAFVPGRQGLTEADAAAWADELVALGGTTSSASTATSSRRRAGASAPDRSA